MNILFELDPNVVKPGWTPLLILIGLALVMVLLFRSMKRQFARVHTNFPEAVPPGRVGAESAAPTEDGAVNVPTSVNEVPTEVAGRDQR